MKGYVILALILLGTAVWQVWLCVHYPYEPCPRCKGGGRKTQPGNSKRWRDCRKCGGTGRRLRLGRRLFNFARERS